MVDEEVLASLLEVGDLEPEFRPPFARPLGTYHRSLAKICRAGIPKGQLQETEA